MIFLALFMWIKALLQKDVFRLKSAGGAGAQTHNRCLHSLF